MKRLQGMGCDLAQGLYFSEPLTREAAERLIATRRSKHSYRVRAHHPVAGRYQGRGTDRGAKPGPQRPDLRRRIDNCVRAFASDDGAEAPQGQRAVPLVEDLIRSRLALLFPLRQPLWRPRAEYGTPTTDRSEDRLAFRAALTVPNGWETA